MKLRKVEMPLATLLLICFLGGLLLGLGGGWGAGYYNYIKKPQLVARQEQEKQKAESEKMLRHGQVVSVANGSLTVKVTSGGGDVGKTRTYYTSNLTNVQIGQSTVGGGSMSAASVDLTRWFIPGDYAHFMAKDDQMVNLYRPSRPGEAPPASQEKRAPQE